MNNWQEEVNFAITVCDLAGRILYMNKKSCRVFKKSGGKKLIGVKKLIYQTPWLKGGKPRGLAELSFELPGKLPHFVRK